MLQTQTVEQSTLELLKTLMQKPYLNSFFLVGGTSLSLQIGHRQSIDLDLFTTENFDAELIYQHLEEDFNITQTLVKLKQTLILEIDNVKVDLIRFKYPLLFPIKQFEHLRLADIRDIAPMKLDAMSARGKKKDFFDIFFLLEKFSLEKMLEFHVNMYPHGTAFHIIRSLTYFEDAEADGDPIVFDKSITWEKVKKELREQVRKLS